MEKHDAKRDFQPEGNKITMSAMHKNRFSSAASPAVAASDTPEPKSGVKAE